MANMADFQIDKWVPETDGQLNESNMIAKLKSQGYRKDAVYTFPAGTSFPDHSHSVDKKDVVVSGNLSFTMLGKEVILGPGDMLYVPKGVKHSACVLDQDVRFIDCSKA